MDLNIRTVLSFGVGKEDLNLKERVHIIFVLVSLLNPVILTMTAV